MNKLKSFTTHFINEMMLKEIANSNLNKNFRTSTVTEPQIKRGDAFAKKFLNDPEHGENWETQETSANEPKHSEPFALTDGSAVRLIVTREQANQLRAALKASEEAREAGKVDTKPYNLTKMKFTTEDGRVITLKDLAYTHEFGGQADKPKISGKTLNKEIRESYNCWYTAAAFADPKFGFESETSHYQSDTFQQIVEDISKVAGRVHCDLNADEAAVRVGEPNKKGKISDEEWSLIKTADLIADSSKFKSNKSGYEFFKDSTTDMGHLLKTDLFGVALKNTPEAGFSGSIGSDKWNPADMWIVKSNKKDDIVAWLKQKIEEGTITFAEYNAQMIEWFDANDLVGISLKKLARNAQANIHVYNDRRVAKPTNIAVTFDSIKTVAKGKGALTNSKSIELFFNYGRQTIRFNIRNFQANTGSIAGELLGIGARGGKLSDGQIESLLKETFADSKQDNAKYDLQTGAIKNMGRDELIESIIRSGKIIASYDAEYKQAMRSETEDRAELETWHTYSLVAKAIGLRLAAILYENDQELSEYVDHFADEVYHKSASAGEYSSVFMKVFSSKDEE